MSSKFKPRLITMDDNLWIEIDGLARKLSEENNRRVSVSELIRVALKRMLNTIK